ncbi:bifunctional cytidylyltransferase/SDR family oxidoreductase [Streptomyces sp. NBC_01351]|uniref:bifunctional cytidylyltransferase/SDR family oxidoreductase n=1 Tax=Streptomyces sp. NBC_01351 TaxID=2903833 RepID=UPI002E30F5C0|nr:bifunctional cytidylyltransferase/SDR family oxidoreductase [Streptomyces sp. NBC_01351]
MSRNARTIAVVLAGGTGQRIGLAIPKQLVKIAGRTILEHTLTIFQENTSVDEILVVMHADHVEEVERIVAAAGLDKVTGVIAGGSTRNETTCRAIDTITAGLADDEPDPKLLFHDAVRPLLSQRVIDDCVLALDKYEAVDVAIPSADTIIVTRTHGDDGEFITEIPDRSRLRRGQTPQGFLLSTIRRAYLVAAGDPNFEATDDCSVVLRYLPDVPIHVVEGEEHNMKVTHPVDIFIADKFFQLAHQAAPAHGDDETYRAALTGKSLVVFGASYGIGADVADFAESYGATVFRYSRSGTGTFVEDPAHVEKALAEAHASAGRIDYVVNTAGVLRTGKLAETDHEAIEKATLVNYLAPVHIARASHQYLAETGGQLLLYTSSSYTRGRAGYSLYSSAKAATVNLTQALADEWAADGIRVNCVNPERTRTPMRSKAFGEEPADSLLTSESVARTSVDVLISQFTGHVIDVRRLDPFKTVAVPEGDLADAFAKADEEI